MEKHYHKNACVRNYLAHHTQMVVRNININKNKHDIETNIWKLQYKITTVQLQYKITNNNYV